jgi:hypothetical protein
MPYEFSSCNVSYKTNAGALYIYLLIRFMRYPLKSFLTILWLLPVTVIAQRLPGVWIGFIHNDSTNLNLYYEVVISQQKGKLAGYTFTNFIVDGKELTGVKTIKVSTKSGKIYFEDDDLIYNDYPFEPPKGVRQLSAFELKGEDMLEGKFITSRTRQYGRPVTGTISLQRVKDFEAAKIYPVLKRMDLLAGLSFMEPPVDIAKNDPPPKEEPPVVIAKTTPPQRESQVKTTPVVVPPAKKQEPVKKETSAPVAVAQKAIPDLKKELDKRKVEAIQTVFFTADSLQLELYDNGYVDGDSVSILLNGKELLTHVRLTERAVKKMIHITPEMGDSINLVMFAENLGSIAPNSGLAIIRDGKKLYRITFTGDLEKNAAIILRRRKK